MDIYKAKYLVIEAVKLIQDSWVDMLIWLGDCREDARIQYDDGYDICYIYVKTKESGLERAEKGEYIIKYNEGNFEVLSETNFKKLYIKVIENEQNQS